MARYSIGIDPGRHTGYARYDREEKRIDYLAEKDFWWVYHDVILMHEAGQLHEVLIEKPKNDHLNHEAPDKKRQGKIGVNVGRVLEQTDLLIEGIERQGIKVIKVPPMGKVDKHVFKRITGYQGLTNPHKRDAGMLCWGR